MKTATILIVIGVVIFGGALLMKNGNSDAGTGAPSQTEAASLVDGKQVIAIIAKGGYSPRVTTAKANLPTIIRVTTKGTFDCSSALIIPDIDYEKNLPPSGVTDIEVPAQKAGTRLLGMCSMGMYSFTVNFTE
jgi:plastocyanin domain-containing protein